MNQKMTLLANTISEYLAIPSPSDPFLWLSAAQIRNFFEVNHEAAGEIDARGTSLALRRAGFEYEENYDKLELIFSICSKHFPRFNTIRKYKVKLIKGEPLEEWNSECHHFTKEELDEINNYNTESKRLLEEYQINRDKIHSDFEKSVFKMCDENFQNWAVSMDELKDTYLGYGPVSTYISEGMAIDPSGYIFSN